MSLDPLADFKARLEAVERYVATNPLENASVTSGRVRIIGGLFRVDSGGRVEIVGTLDVDGETTVTGPTEITGALELTGTTNINGPTSIKGATTVTGTFTSTGAVNLNGPTNIRGDAKVIGGGKLTVGTGNAAVALDSSYSSPRINLGTVQVQAGTSGDTLTFTLGTNIVYFAQNTIRIPALPSPPSDATGLRYAVVDALGRFWAAPSGGPIPGQPGNPGTPGEPGDNAAGYIYPVNPDAWTLGDNFQAHVNRGSQEPGIDWFTSWGTPVWAPGDGTIVDVKPTNSDATGRYVTLVTDAGDWFRFLHLSSFPVSPGQRVSQGNVIAYTGGSGFGSDAGYGLHVHVSFKRGYTGTSWPGATALNDLLAYMAA